jgi:hypothetical protein
MATEGFFSVDSLAGVHVLVVDASSPNEEGLRLIGAVRKLKPENGGVVRRDSIRT